MSNLTNVDAFSFLQWATIDPSYYDELFYNLGLCKIAELESNGDVVWDQIMSIFLLLHEGLIL